MKVYYYNDYLTQDERDEARKEAENRKKARAAEQQQAKQDNAKWQAEQKKKARWDYIRKAWGYLTLEFVQIRKGPTPRKEYKRRVSLCMSCPGRTEELQGMKDVGGIGFCTKCGCPASQRSQLSVKLTIAGLACPLNKFGPVKGSGATWRSAVQSVLGVLATIRAVGWRRK